MQIMIYGSNLQITIYGSTLEIMIYGSILQIMIYGSNLQIVICYSNLQIGIHGSKLQIDLWINSTCKLGFMDPTCKFKIKSTWHFKTKSLVQVTYQTKKPWAAICECNSIWYRWVHCCVDNMQFMSYHGRILRNGTHSFFQLISTKQPHHCSGHYPSSSWLFRSMLCFCPVAWDWQHLHFNHNLAFTLTNCPGQRRWALSADVSPSPVWLLGMKQSICCHYIPMSDSFNMTDNPHHWSPQRRVQLPDW